MFFIVLAIFTVFITIALQYILYIRSNRLLQSYERAIHDGVYIVRTAYGFIAIPLTKKNAHRFRHRPEASVHHGSTVFCDERMCAESVFLHIERVPSYPQHAAPDERSSAYYEDGPEDASVYDACGCDLRADSPTSFDRDADRNPPTQTRARPRNRTRERTASSDDRMAQLPRSLTPADDPPPSPASEHAPPHAQGGHRRRWHPSGTSVGDTVHVRTGAEEPRGPTAARTDSPRTEPGTVSIVYWDEPHGVTGT